MKSEIATERSRADDGHPNATGTATRDGPPAHAVSPTAVRARKLRQRRRAGVVCSIVLPLRWCDVTLLTQLRRFGACLRGVREATD